MKHSALAELEFRDLKGAIIHDFPYKKANRKCPHTALISITHSGACVHNCPMCYARAYPWSSASGGENKLIVYKNLIPKLESEINQASILPPFYISQVSDALQPVPEIRKITFDIVKLLMKYKLSFRIITKSADGALELLKEIPELKKYPYWYIAITVEATEEKQKITSPGASKITDRLSAIKELTNAGVPVVGRTDPTILGFIGIEEVCENIKQLASAGAKHIIGSLGYYNVLSMGRLVNALENSQWRNSIPLIEGFYGFKANALNTYPSNKRFMTSLSTRIKFHSILKTAAEKSGLTYAVCLELPNKYDSQNIKTCEAMPNNFVHIKGVNGEFQPINCSADCIRSCPDVQKPLCAVTGKMPFQEYPYKLKELMSKNLPRI
ncbi:MAG: radical SAM protein [bacterium]